MVAKLAFSFEMLEHPAHTTRITSISVQLRKPKRREENKKKEELLRENDFELYMNVIFDGYTRRKGRCDSSFAAINVKHYLEYMGRCR